jgi:hypothetical protein
MNRTTILAALAGLAATLATAPATSAAAGPRACGTTANGYRVEVSSGLKCAYGRATANRVRDYRRTHGRIPLNGTPFSVRVRDTDTGRYYRMRCSADGGPTGGSIACGFNTGRTGYVNFSYGTGGGDD